MNDGNISLILGPMFSGKTTELIKRYKNSILNNQNNEKYALAINYALDKRYGINQIISHNKEAINCISILDLSELINNNNYYTLFLEAKHLFINEGQFFNNLKISIDYFTKVLKKDVTVCGLDYDFNREKFGDLLDISIENNDTLFLTANCNTPECKNEAIYSHRIDKSNSLQILIGTNEYVPLCENCYNKNNDLIII